MSDTTNLALKLTAIENELRNKDTRIFELSIQLGIAKEELETTRREHKAILWPLVLSTCFGFSVIAYTVGRYLTIV